MQLAWVAAAFAIHWAWQTCVVYLPAHADVSGAPSPWYLQNALGVLAYVVITVLAPRVQRVVDNRAAQAAAAALLVASVALRGVAGPVPALPLAAGALSAAGGAFLTVGRFDLLCRVGKGSDRMAVLLVATVAQILAFLLLRSLPQPLWWLMVAAMPLALVVAMARASYALGGPRPAEIDVATGRERAGLPATQLMAFFLLAMAINFIRATIESSGAYDSRSIEVAGLTTLVTVLLVSLVLALGKAEGDRMAPFSVVVSITAAIVVLLVDSDLARYAGALVSAGFYVFVALFWQRTARYADARPHDSAYVCAVTHVVYTAGLFFGQLLFRAMGPAEGAGLFGPLLVIADLALVGAFVLFIRDTLARSDPDRQIYLAPGLAGTVEADCELIARGHGLTEREKQAIVDLALGKSLRAAAEGRCVSENTVKTHVAHAYRKLDVHSREELMELVCATDLERLSVREGGE